MFLTKKSSGSRSNSKVNYQSADSNFNVEVASTGLGSALNRYKGQKQPRQTKSIAPNNNNSSGNS